MAEHEQSVDGPVVWNNPAKSSIYNVPFSTVDALYYILAISTAASTASSLGIVVSQLPAEPTGADAIFDEPFNEP